MSTKRAVPAALLATFGLVALLPASPPEIAPGQVRAAVVKALPLLHKGAAGYIDHRQCFACHHQALPMLALTTARARGFEVDEQELVRQLKFTAQSLTKNRDGYEQGRGQGGQVDTAGYALWTLELAGGKPDSTTSAVAEYLLLRYADLDYWRATSKRPPSEASSFTTTYLALRGLQVFGGPEQQERIAARTDVVRRWLQATPAQDTEDRVFRLWALKLAGAPGSELEAAAQELRQGQRKDGGWGQTDELASDAYATGSALVVLYHAAEMAASDPAYQRGLQFLVRTQLEDGSWYVRSRSKPFQTYFESGFPHGKDQFISIAASSWATTALALACPPPS
jgi:hypothetical protein